jgi:hypothetical protein
MDLNRIRQLLREGHSVVLVEDGKAPLVVRELPVEAPLTEVPIASKWPKGRSIHGEEPVVGNGIRQDQILERLNKEILALREQLAQEG